MIPRVSVYVCGSGGGYICQGQADEIDGGRVFVKSHNKPQGRFDFLRSLISMFAG
uniref:Uncharacterized protein n=1 Tax=Pseudonaja textilis TaxID=8673 RepID=A0A670Y645_PSETE